MPKRQRLQRKNSKTRKNVQTTKNKRLKNRVKTKIMTTKLKKYNSKEERRNCDAKRKILQEIKQKLLTQRDSLLREAEDTLNILPAELNFPDMGDQATAETDRTSFCG